MATALPTKAERLIRLRRERRPSRTPGRARHQRGRQAHGEAPHAGRGCTRRRAPSSAASAERASRVSHRPTALTKRSGRPAQGWWASCVSEGAVARGAGGDRRRGGGQHEVEDQVHHGGRRVGSAEAAAGGERPPAPAGVGHDAEEARRRRGRRAPPVSGRGSTRATSAQRGLRQRAGPDGPAQPRGSVGRPPGSSAARARAVSSGRTALADAGDDEQARGDQVEADQFHSGPRGGDVGDGGAQRQATRAAR